MPFSSIFNENPFREYSDVPGAGARETIRHMLSMMHERVVNVSTI
jgi:hypothetical protein